MHIILYPIKVSVCALLLPQQPLMVGCIGVMYSLTYTLVCICIVDHAHLQPIAISLSELCQILCAAPSVPPRFFSCFAGPGPEVQLTWEPPPQSMKNGVIQEYNIHYFKIPLNPAEEAIELEEVVPGNVTSLTIDNLTPLTDYNFTIQAVTVAPGPAASILCTTGI